MGKGERASWRREYEEEEPILKTLKSATGRPSTVHIYST